MGIKINGWLEVIVFEYPSKTHPVVVNCYWFPTRELAEAARRRTKREWLGSPYRMLAHKVRPALADVPDDDRASEYPNSDHWSEVTSYSFYDRHSYQIQREHPEQRDERSQMTFDTTERILGSYCEKCGAEPGVWCLLPNGRPFSSLHRARHKVLFAA